MHIPHPHIIHRFFLEKSFPQFFFNLLVSLKSQVLKSEKNLQSNLLI